jgi:hypothetical protein
MRVILIDGDGKALTRIAAADPDQIETLTIPEFKSDITSQLRDAWGSEPLSMVVNLMPLAYPGAINNQMRSLAAILRTTARGLAAAKGRIISVVARPDTPLALVGLGRVAAVKAGSAALGEAMAGHAVRAHVITVPHDGRDLAVDCLLHLSTPEAQPIASTSIDLG